MKKTVLGLVLMFLMFGSCSAKDKSLSLTPAQPTKIVANVWDLGQVKRGESIEHAFVFKNDADKTVTVSSIQTSCGCTGTKIKDKTLAPGQSTDITVRFDSKGYREGPVEQFLYINTDNADNPIIKYTVKIDVRA